MKKCFAILWIFLVGMVGAQAQSYSKLYKEVAEAYSRDLPKSAIASLDRIINKAQQQGDADQLLKAMMARMQASLQISPDSAEAMMPRFIQICESQTSEPAQSVYQLVLGWLLQSQDSRLHPLSADSAYIALSKAVSNPQALRQARSKDWCAILEMGKDSRIYQDDMLSVIFPFAARQLRSLNTNKGDSLAAQAMHKEIEIYATHAMPAAQMMAMIDSARICGVEDSVFYSSLIKKFGNLEDITQAYVWLARNTNDSIAYAVANKALQRYPRSKDANTLKNIVLRLTQPNASITTTTKGDSMLAIISHTNLNEITLGLSLTPYAAYSPQILNIKDRDYGHLYSNPVMEKRIRLTASDPWRQVSDTIKIPRPKIGVYIIKVGAPNIKEQYSLFYASRLAVIQLPLPNEKVRVCVVDAFSGEPQANAAIKTATQNGTTTLWQTLHADKDGEIVLPSPRTAIDLYPATPADSALPAVSLIRSYSYSWDRINSDRYASIHTDRAIYRPGQRVKVGGFLYSKTGDSTAVIPSAPITLTLHDANGKKIESVSTLTDEFGSFGAEYTLPQHCLNGTFSIRHERGYTSFKVEEYKRPNFRVTLLQPTTGYSLGDTVLIHGKAETYSGFPLSDTEVICSTVRNGSWWFRSPSYIGSLTTQKDTILTDSEGNFTVRVALIAPKNEGKQNYWPEFYSFTLTARATALDGESEEASLRLSAGTAKASVQTNIPDMLCREQPPRLTATQTNSAGQSVDGKGKYILFAGSHSLEEIIKQLQKDSINSANGGISSASGSFSAANNELYSANGGSFSANGSSYSANGGSFPANGGAFPANTNGNKPFAKAITAIRNGQVSFQKNGGLDSLFSLPTGEYTIVIRPSDDENLYHAFAKTFTVFSLSDNKPASTAPLQLWQSGDFNKRDTVDVLLSTALRDAWLHYDIMAGERLVHSERIAVSDTVLHFRYHWDEDWKTGAHIQFAVYRDGKLYTRSLVLTKPVPNKKLRIKWETFRDKLQPGASETWTLRITKDGKPVSASILATMYDASLDKFAPHALNFALTYPRFVPRLNWSPFYPTNYYTNLTKGLSYHTESARNYTRLNLFGVGRNGIGGYVLGNSIKYKGIGRKYNSIGRKYNSIAHYDLEEVAVAPQMTMAKMDRVVADSFIAESAPAIGNNEAAQGAKQENADILSNTALRSDFSETAFFAPALRTDANGEARIQFTLPQSLTRWNFRALAHTQDLCYGTLDTVAVVSKPFMVQANIPRFLREGDKAFIAVSILNNDSLPHSGRVQLAIIDAPTGKQLPSYLNVPSVMTRSFSVKAKKDTVILFPVDAMEGHPLFICRYSASSGDFIDGEQQYLPVLSALQQTQSTVPFTLTNSKPAIVSLKSLDYKKNSPCQRLTVEYTGNPAWTALNALPTTLNYQTHCLTQIAANYCALTLLQQILQQNPQIRSLLATRADSVPAVMLPLANNAALKQLILSETPWISAADRERERLSGLKDDSTTMAMKQATMLQHLQQMQSGDGGWQWYPGMKPSTWLSLDVAEMLVRLKTLAPAATSAVSPMLNKALAYLDREAANAVAEMKKYKPQTIPTQWLRYLYIVAYNGHNATDNEQSATDKSAKRTADARKYLLERLDLSATGYNMYDKAMAACVLAANKREKEAALTMRSLLEHTVSTESMGRYFDSDRAPLGWSMYRIPTQIAAIEAVKKAMPQAADTLRQLRLWLMQSKHTQSWADPLVACRAVECLLEDGALASPTAVPNKLEITMANGSRTDLLSPKATTNEALTIDPFVQMGYVNATIDADGLKSAPVSLKIEPSAASIEQQTAFGAVYLQNWVKATDIEQSNSGITLRSSLWIETDTPQEKNATQWTPMRPDTKLHKGDRLKIRYEITTTRDLDFVGIKDGRAACLEPVEPLSGYDWRTGAYREVEDAGTTYFFQHLSKGTHVVETVYAIDRSGTYSSASATAQCQYAPELCGRAKAYTLTILP